MTKPTRVDYCQYLFSTPLDYTLLKCVSPDYKMCSAFYLTHKNYLHRGTL